MTFSHEPCIHQNDFIGKKGEEKKIILYDNEDKPNIFFSFLFYFISSRNFVFFFRHFFDYIFSFRSLRAHHCYHYHCYHYHFTFSRDIFNVYKQLNYFLVHHFTAFIIFTWLSVSSKVEQYIHDESEMYFIPSWFVLEEIFRSDSKKKKNTKH